MGFYKGYAGSILKGYEAPYKVFKPHSYGMLHACSVETVFSDARNPGLPKV